MRSEKKSFLPRKRKLLCLARCSANMMKTLTLMQTKQRKLWTNRKKPNKLYEETC